MCASFKKLLHDDRALFKSKLSRHCLNLNNVFESRRMIPFRKMSFANCTSLNLDRHFELCYDQPSTKGFEKGTTR